MKIGIDDAKRIVNKVTHGGGDYTPLEIELAKMVVKYRQPIGRLADEKQKIFDNLYKVYNAIHNTEFAADLKHKPAVKLDTELKGLIDNDAKEKI